MEHRLKREAQFQVAPALLVARAAVEEDQCLAAGVQCQEEEEVVAQCRAVPVKAEK